MTAENRGYINGWWSNYEILPTEFGPLNLYKIDHPKKLGDIKIIYKLLNEILPEMDIDLERAGLSYFASITIQSLRRTLLKGRIIDTSPSLHSLYIRLQNELKNVIETSPIFRVNLAYVVEITEETEPFRIMNDYKKYIRIL